VEHAPAIGDAGGRYRTREERLTAVSARLVSDRDLWLITSHPASGPHAIPLSFVVEGPAVILSTARHRPAARNAALDPRVVLVLGGYGDAIRAAGVAEIVPFESLDTGIRMRYVAKAGWDPAAVGFAALVVRLEEILCSRSPDEDRDRVVWRAGSPVPW
jgi:hypothetical protein